MNKEISPYIIVKYTNAPHEHNVRMLFACKHQQECVRYKYIIYYYYYYYLLSISKPASIIVHASLKCFINDASINLRIIGH